MQRATLPIVLSRRRFNRQNQVLPCFYIQDQNYTLKIAQTEQEIDEVLHLRFKIFNLELGEGLSKSYYTFRDEDKFDAHCSHLIITDNTTGKIIGTYRMQTYEMAIRGRGFYSNEEFTLDKLPRNILRNSVELGRACIAKEYRNSRVLFLLWRGLMNYIHLTRKRYMFGCCSLTSQDACQGYWLLDHLEENGHIHESYVLKAQPDYALSDRSAIEETKLPDLYPHLLKMYLRYGAKIVGEPAIDKNFKTIDYFVLMDISLLNKETIKLFLG